MILTANAGCDFPGCCVCWQGFVVLTQFRLDHAKKLGANWEKFPIVYANRQFKWHPCHTNFSGGIYNFFHHCVNDGGVQTLVNGMASQK